MNTKSTGDPVYNDPLNDIKTAFLKTIKTVFDIELEDTSAIKIENPPNPEMGDIGIGCFPLAKTLRKNPAQIASEIENAGVDCPYIKSSKAVGPFLNFTIDLPELLKTLCDHIQQKGADYGKSDTGNGKTVMVEYSAPNTNKPQHLGHVRNNVLGMAVSNIIEAAGYDILRVNLVNDRGIHICKSMLAYDKWGEGATPESTNKKGDHFVGDYYVKFEQELQKDPALIEQAQEMLVKWEEEDQQVRELWKKMNSWVLNGFKETYDRQGCKFDELFLESNTYKLGKDVALDALEKGLARKNDRGDIVVDLDGFDTPEKVLLRADGTSIYITQDLGTTALKFKDRNLERALWVVASEQNLHFKILFHVMKKFGYEWADKCYHLSYGMVYLPEGKMKSREGKVIDADNLMDMLKNLAKDEIEKRAREMSENEIDQVSESIGQAALKFYILKVNPQKDINFSPEESVSFDGSTGPFAQYSHARLSSILRKGTDIIENTDDFTSLGNPEEKKLGILLAEYPRIVADSASGYNPAKLAGWLFEFARAINKFHHDHSVLNNEDKSLTNARGKLVAAARQVLANGLQLLGITPLERM